MCIVMDSVVASSAVDHWFKSGLGKTKDYKIGICSIFAKHAALRIKSKDWFACYQNNVHMCPIGMTCLPAHCCFSE